MYCLFLIAQQKNTKNYNLKEIYSVKEKLFSLNYGMWSHYSGLITSKNSIYVRRLNLNDTEVILDTGDEQVRFHNSKIVIFERNVIGLMSCHKVQSD